MKPAPFDYRRAGDVAEAVALLRQGGGAAKLLAGGQSLGPMLNLRLVRVGLLVDVRRIEALSTVDDDGERIRYGAMLTHSAVEDGRVPDAGNGLMRHVAAGIAYRAVRNRGTLGGSLVHADPAADWLAAMLALDARLHLQGGDGARSIALSEALAGAFTLDIADDEVLTGIEVAKLSPAARWGWCKLNRKAGEFADAIGVAVLDPERGRARVVCGALDAPPCRFDDIAEALRHEGGEAAVALLPAALTRAQPALPAVARQLHTVALKRAVQQVFTA